MITFNTLKKDIMMGEKTYNGHTKIYGRDFTTRYSIFRNAVALRDLENGKKIYGGEIYFSGDISKKELRPYIAYLLFCVNEGKEEEFNSTVSRLTELNALPKSGFYNTSFDLQYIHKKLLPALKEAKK